MEPTTTPNTGGRALSFEEAGSQPHNPPPPRSPREAGGAADPTSPTDPHAGGDPDAEPQCMFSCRLDNAKEVQTLLTCLVDGTKKDQHALCEARPDGLTFLVASRNKTTQVSGTLPRHLFGAFECDVGGRFCLNLTLLIDCLGMFGPMAAANTSLTMAYLDAECRFRLTLEEQGVFTSCDIRVLDGNVEDDAGSDWSSLASSFRERAEVFKAIIRSENLREALHELRDLTGANTAHVVVSPGPPHFQLSAHGSVGKLEIEFPRNSNLFDLFECEAPATFKYQLEALLQGMRAIAVSEETYFRISPEGIMCIQHQVNSSCGMPLYVDFLMVPNIADDPLMPAPPPGASSQQSTPTSSQYR